jgi:hypothetical protein
VRLPRRTLSRRSLRPVVALSCLAAPGVPTPLHGQGVTTGNLVGIVTDSAGIPVADANVVAVHLPSGTQYRAVARGSGAYSLLNLRVGGPYRVTATRLGYQPGARENVVVNLAETQRIDFQLARAAARLGPVQVSARAAELEGTRTGAATFVDPLQVAALPSVKRSTRDLIRIDPRNDGNYSFAGRNWLFNNISLDGSYFNNSFGLDDPAPGGQTSAELLGDIMMTLSRHLNDLQEARPELWRAVISALGLHLETAEQIAAVTRPFRALPVDDATLGRIGWPRLRLISPRVDETNWR